MLRCWDPARTGPKEFLHSQRGGMELGLGLGTWWQSQAAPEARARGARLSTPAP